MKCPSNHYHEDFHKECPMCKNEQERKLGKAPKPYKMTQAEKVYNCYPSQIAEFERLKTLETPMSFTDEKPDTPESLAAKRQWEISRGKDVPNYDLSHLIPKE